MYKIVGRDASNNYAIRQMILQATEAAAVNIPGAITYPAYVVAPSTVTRVGVGINPNYLSLESDARMLLALSGATGLIDEGSSAVFPTIYPPNEPRRMWDIIFKGEPLNVGLMMLQQSVNGIGAPGSWDWSTNDPQWVAAPTPPTGLDDMRAPRDMPVRDLLANEKFQVGLMGTSIVRVDLQNQANQQAGEFTRIIARRYEDLPDIESVQCMKGRTNPAPQRHQLAKTTPRVTGSRLCLRSCPPDIERRRSVVAGCY